MVIYSEILEKTFGSVDDCLAAEAEYEKEQKKIEEEEKVRQEELNKAYEEAIAACDKYLELAGVKEKEGYRVKLYNDEDDSADEVFEAILNILFN